MTASMMTWMNQFPSMLSWLTMEMGESWFFFVYTEHFVMVDQIWIFFRKHTAAQKILFVTHNSTAWSEPKHHAPNNSKRSSPDLFDSAKESSL